MANKIYHLCFPESKVPGPLFSHHNDTLLKEGAIASLKYRRGPLVDKKDIYLVFWHEEGKVFFSRINTALYGLDWQFFKDGHEMVECKDWEELTGKLKEFNEKGSKLLAYFFYRRWNKFSRKYLNGDDDNFGYTIAVSLYERNKDGLYNAIKR